MRLFPRSERLPVLVVQDGQAEALGFVLRRLRRSPRLELSVATGRHAAAALGDGTEGGTAPAAVITATGDHPAAVASLRRLAAQAGTVPVVAVVSGGRDAALAALQAGAEEVVERDRASGPELERAVLAAVTRRVTDRREGRDGARDALTGLATRAQLDADLPSLLRDVTTGRQQLAVLFCDLDRLKVVNDSLGHGVGDAVIVEAADRLRRAVRSSDDVVRVGGDEFVVVLRGERAAVMADDVARRVVEAFAVPVEVAEHRLSVGVSVGLAVARPGESAEHLLERADRALYLAKRRGRGRVATSEPRTAVEGAEGLSDTLRDALVRDLLVLERHHVVSPGDGRLLGVRHVPAWPQRAAHRPVATPAQVAEDSGLSPALCSWTARAMGLEATGATPSAGLVSSTGAAPRRRFLDLPRAVLAASPARRLEAAWAGEEVDPSTVVLLVDERHLLDPDAVRPSLLELARSGFRLGISRFAAAHGALMVLERHPFDSVWLDRDAVEGLGSCAVRRARLRAVVEVASALGQQVVAPAPRRPEDAAVLAEVGGVALELAPVDLRATVRSDPAAHPSSV